MLEKTKQAAKFPRFNAVQLVIFIISVIFFILTRTDWFARLDNIYIVAIYVVFAIVMLLSAGQIGTMSGFINKVIKVLVNDDSMDQKVIQIQNLVVALCQELGIYFEKEKEKIVKEYLDQARKEKEIELEELRKLNGG